MHGMYAKLFSRIAQSSLMEQNVETRYCFMMLLAIADIEGDVIGTDVAIARSINVPLAVFQSSINALMQPDPQSNSKVMDGRRIVNSENGRGLELVKMRGETCADFRNALRVDFTAALCSAKSPAFGPAFAVVADALL